MTGVSFPFDPIKLALDGPPKKLQLSVLSLTQQLTRNFVTRFEQVFNQTLEISTRRQQQDVVHVSHHQQSRHKVGNKYTGCKHADDTLSAPTCASQPSARERHGDRTCSFASTLQSVCFRRAYSSINSHVHLGFHVTPMWERFADVH